MHDQELSLRIERLEKRNRFLTLACGVCLTMPMLMLMGFQSQVETARLKKLEIIDEQGVPVITLDAGRIGDGGSIVMRDKLGEKRSWWEVAPESGAFTLNSAKPDGTNDTTLGLQVGPENARLSIIGKEGSRLSVNMEKDEPKLEMIGAKGNTLFAAPWRPVGSGG